MVGRGVGADAEELALEVPFVDFAGVPVGAVEAIGRGGDGADVVVHFEGGEHGEGLLIAALDDGVGLGPVFGDGDPEGGLVVREAAGMGEGALLDLDGAEGLAGVEVVFEEVAAVGGGVRGGDEGASEADDEALDVMGVALERDDAHGGRGLERGGLRWQRRGADQREREDAEVK
jgi:hypothetical protein